jgi:phage head maturation protease
MAINPTPETPLPIPSDGLATIIRAASPTDGPARASLAATAPIEIQAAKGEGTRPTFDIVGYTGAIMSLEGFFNPVIIDLAGFKAGGQEIPALYLHELDRIVGQTDSVSIDAKGVRLTGTITGDNADATEVLNQARNGFKWRASVGATLHRREFLDAGKKATVNGREVMGPLVIAREAELLEISFVSIGGMAEGQGDRPRDHRRPRPPGPEGAVRRRAGGQQAPAARPQGDADPGGHRRGPAQGGRADP